MNQEEIDNLETYLKDKLAKEVPIIPISTFGSVNLEDLMDSIRQFKKVPTSDELLRENKRLREQLEEKDKVIDEAKKFLKEFHNYENRFKWCEEDYIQTILAIEAILERGKNDN